MRFSPGCGCCGASLPVCDPPCPMPPTTLFATIDIACAGWSGVNVTLTHFGQYNGFEAWRGTIPSSCGTCVDFMVTIGCNVFTPGTTVVTFSFLTSDSTPTSCGLTNLASYSVSGCLAEPIDVTDDVVNFDSTTCCAGSIGGATVIGTVTVTE